MLISRKEKVLSAPPVTTEAYSKYDNNKWVFTYSDGTRAFVKGDSPVGNNRRRNASQRNERAAYLVAKALGFKALVPPTVLYKFRGRVVSVQEWVDGDTARATQSDGILTPPPEIQTFDYIIGNCDRHLSNWMVTRRGFLSHRYVAIDNAYSFIVGRHPMSPIDFTFKPAWHTLIKNPQHLVKQLTPLIGRVATRELLVRLQYLADEHARRTANRRG